MGGGLRSERALRVHDRHPLIGAQGGLGEGEEESRAPASQGRVQGGDLPARDAGGERGIERRDAEGEAAPDGGDESAEPLGKRELRVRQSHRC